MVKVVANGITWIVALFYGYGASVHVMNILSLGGFNWLNAPRKWQVLDVVYLVLDLIVAVGFFVRWKVSYAAFYLAAVSQVILYTYFRAWILEVPEAFAVSPEHQSYLTALVVFHGVTLALITTALWGTHGDQGQAGT